MNESSGLTKMDIYTVVNRYIGVSGGYLGDFSYRTHREFYLEYCDLDIDPEKYQGTTRERFMHVLSTSDPHTQSIILEGIIKKYPIGSLDLRTKERCEEIRGMIAKCRGAASVATPKLSSASEVVRRAIADAETLIQSQGATSAVDRVHTALHGYLMAACKEVMITYPKDASINELFKLLREGHPGLENLGAHKDQITQVFRSLAAVLDALNPVRNRGSMAHPNENLLDPDEATLFINAARTILQYLHAKL